MTEVKIQQGEYTIQGIQERKLGGVGWEVNRKKNTVCQLQLLCLRSLNFVHYNLDFAFILVIEYAMNMPITVTLSEYASTAEAPVCDA